MNHLDMTQKSYMSSAAVLRFLWLIKMRESLDSAFSYAGRWSKAVK